MNTYTGMCRKHGKTGYYIQSRKCVTCIKERGAARRKKYADQIKVDKAKYYQHNKERITAKRRERYAKDPTADNEACRKWRDGNREYTREYNQRYYYANRDAILAQKCEYYMRMNYESTHPYSETFSRIEGLWNRATVK